MTIELEGKAPEEPLGSEDFYSSEVELPGAVQFFRFRVLGGSIF